ncbi:hypothetical protein ACNOYE_09000 [Nannocystaceae bacterium ST9]
MSEQPNPYAAPTAGSEHARASGYRLSDELRSQIAGVAKLMLVAGGLQISSSTLGLIRDGISIETGVVAGIAGVVPLFVMMAGITLLGIAGAGPRDDLATLNQGFRQLSVAFVVKGVVLLLIIGLGLLGLVLGFGRALL